MKDETIMPDGRPLFAWRNEISLLNAEARRTEEDRRNIAHLMKILNVVRVDQQREPHTGDYVIRVRRTDLASSYTDTEAIEKAEVIRLPDTPVAGGDATK